MRLRNKKTGEIDDFIFEVIFDRIDLYRRVGTTETKNVYSYNSLAELNEEWEDVKEPLIKDEKIRKVVQAWAKLNNIGSVVILDAKSHIIVRSRIGISYDLEFNHDYIGAFKNIEFGEPYAIEELCGEEE